MKHFARYLLPAVFLFSLIVPAGSALASNIKYDSGYIYQSADDPYQVDQAIGNVEEDTGVYALIDSGEQGAVKIYSFTPNSDVERNFSLLFTPKKGVEATNESVDLLLVDPTANTTATAMYESLPLPSDEYHITGIKKADAGAVYNDPYLWKQYKVSSSERVKLAKDKKYYLIVLDYKSEIEGFVIKVGDGNIWSAKSLVTNAGDWWKIKSSLYSGVNPFLIPKADIVNFIMLIVFLLGFSLLFGMFMVSGIFSLLANTYKSAGYLLIKLQKFFKYAIWIALWFVALGGYLYYGVSEWTGVTFAMLIVYLPIVLLFLYLTIRVSPSIEKIEVNNREAVIPLPLAKRLFFSYFFLSILMVVFTWLMAITLK